MTEEDLLRRPLPPDVDHETSKRGMRLDHSVGERERQQQHGQDERRVIPRPRGRQAADGHPQKTGQQHDIGKKREKDDRAAEPADTSEFEKENQKADQEEVDETPALLAAGRSGLPVGFV